MRLFKRRNEAVNIGPFNPLNGHAFAKCRCKECNLFWFEDELGKQCYYRWCITKRTTPKPGAGIAPVTPLIGRPPRPRNGGHFTDDYATVRRHNGKK